MVVPDSIGEDIDVDALIYEYPKRRTSDLSVPLGTQIAATESTITSHLQPADSVVHFEVDGGE